MKNQKCTSRRLCHLKKGGKKNNIAYPPAVCPVANIGEIRKGFQKEVGFELDFEGCLGLLMYEFTGEGTVGGDTAERNFRVCEQWTFILGWFTFTTSNIYMVFY